ncbi:NAD-glutamate dehydrogenase domain-containing protein [Candidatus Riflebacteria bacterium]
MESGKQQKRKSLFDISKNCPLDFEALEKIENELLKRGNLSPDTARTELDWFCTKLGIHEYYLKNTPFKEVALHIEMIHAAGIIFDASSDAKSYIDIKSEDLEKGLYILTDAHHYCLGVEEQLEQKYPGFVVECLKTAGKTRMGIPLRIYMLKKPRFLKIKEREKLTFEKATERHFNKIAEPLTQERYKKLWQESKDFLGPKYSISMRKESTEIRLMISLDKESAKTFMHRFSEVLYSKGLKTNRKYSVPFADGRVIFSHYFNLPKDPEVIERVANEITLISMMPDASPIALKLRDGTFTAEETLFTIAASKFANQFLTTHNEEYTNIARVLKDHPESLGFLSTIKIRLAKDTYTNNLIAQTVFKHTHLVKEIYKVFLQKFLPGKKCDTCQKKLDEIKKMLNQEVGEHRERKILYMFLTFIETTLKTNFYLNEKVALCFRLTPEFLDPLAHPEKPFGIFYIFSREFMGFHIRFRDIARGGIRLIMSRTTEIYNRNLETLFTENYALAATQQKKNKDIPEGGSKGTILLDYRHQDKGHLAFQKYISALTDLLINSPELMDYYGREEFLFLGPDEGTADFMSWAVDYAIARGYRYPRAFTTGKPLSQGGIPHDLYGCTTRGVHQYVLGILQKLGIDEKTITKFQTGGPDGDLGSNEILISKDKTTAIVDGSGVLYDPEGLDRNELKRLAKKRIMVDNFEPGKLSKKGFLVKISDKNVKLPDGMIVLNGEDFRNQFHLTPYSEADLFVPCGGRPAAVNINNWQKLFKNEKPLFKYIVEGANLFITQEARLRLEEKGVILIKDASANKGGVTASSTEVLAAMTLKPKEFKELMVVGSDGKINEFRKKYLKDVLSRISKNADLEFEALWNEKQKKNLCMTVLSDMLSNKINRVTDDIAGSNIFSDRALLKKVCKAQIPSVLVEKLGIDELLKRLPDAYIRAMMATGLAHRFVYKYGLDASEVDFFNYLKSF